MDIYQSFTVLVIAGPLICVGMAILGAWIRAKLKE